MTPALTTELQGVDFALPPVRQDFPTNNAELRLRWLPVGTVSITLADFIAGDDVTGQNGVLGHMGFVMLPAEQRVMVRMRTMALVPFDR